MRREYPLLVVAAFIWGSGHPVIKLILEELHPIQVSLASAALSFLMLASTLPFSRPKGGFRWDRMPWMAAAGIVIFFIYPILSFSALQRIPASVNGILVATSTIFVALIAASILGEALSVANYLGIAASFLGVALIVQATTGILSSPIQGMDASGFVLSLSGALASAVYTILGRRLRDEDPLRVTLVAAGSGAVLQAVAAGASTGFQAFLTASPRTWLLLLYWGLLSGLAYFIYYYSLRRMEAARASSFMYLSPVFAAVTSAVILGEKLTFPFLAGMGLVLSGVRLTQRGWKGMERSRDGGEAYQKN
ncbi:MAG: DMT family transporter [Candidatus Bathyarchaeia archaeon]|nr:DMT family transporter [Candidatus Bathyarchaeota archaeon]